MEDAIKRICSRCGNKYRLVIPMTHSNEDGKSVTETTYICSCGQIEFESGGGGLLGCHCNCDCVH